MSNNLSFSQLDCIAETVYQLDKYVREEITKEYIAGERDYVSTLMAYIRLFLRGIYKVESLYANVDSRVLNHIREQKFGCDSMIIIRAGDKANICMFEAKYPRLKEDSYPWDQKQKSSQKSHFHDQLRRQSYWSEKVTMWELFINDSSIELPEYDKYGSTCILHEHAYDYSKKNINAKKIVWNNKKLKECLRDNLKNHAGKALNLRDILCDILSNLRNEEKLIPVCGSNVILTSIENECIPIPVTSLEISEHIREARYLPETDIVEDRDRDRDRKNIFLSLGFTNVLFVQINKDKVSQDIMLEDSDPDLAIFNKYHNVIECLDLNGYFELPLDRFIEEMKNFHINANLSIDELLIKCKLSL